MVQYWDFDDKTVDVCSGESQGELHVVELTYNLGTISNRNGLDTVGGVGDSWTGCSVKGVERFRIDQIGNTIVIVVRIN